MEIAIFTIIRASVSLDIQVPNARMQFAMVRQTMIPWFALDTVPALLPIIVHALPHTRALFVIFLYAMALQQITLQCVLEMVLVQHQIIVLVRQALQVRSAPFQFVMEETRLIYLFALAMVIVVPQVRVFALKVIFPQIVLCTIVSTSSSTIR